MNVVYYVDGLRDELNDSEKYIKKAMDLKEKHPEWASIYVKMSEDELGHAQNLVKLFEIECKLIAEDEQKYFSDIHSSVMDMYIDQAAHIRMMHQTYNKI